MPSESGSILLDDPFRKVAMRRENELVFIATFGHASRNLIGQRLSAKFGIVGQVYQTGTPYVSADVKEDDFFYAEFDEQLGHKTHSVVCVPIYIGKTVCGVLELINRLDGSIFTERDKTLLEIFAGYTSFTLQNALDAKRAHELAKKDDLTGLYNDRWFNVRLTETLAEARKSGSEAVLIFMDLDRFKVDQRLPRPSRRQPGAARGRLPPQTDRAAGRRHGGALRRRRVRDRPSRHDARRRHRRLRGDPPHDRGDDVPRARVGLQHAAAAPRAALLSASLGIAQHVPATDRERVAGAGEERPPPPRRRRHVPRQIRAARIWSWSAGWARTCDRRGERVGI